MKTKGYYDEGGFLDDGASVDPISGNDVPTGSLAEEVRDDVPAQLSEGEFVVPADVVRYIGLEKLMQMRDQAKSGLAQMEQEGQMGGSPAPMQPDMDDDDNQRLEMDALIEGLDGEDFDGAVQQFAEGGSVRSNLPSYETYTGRKFGEAATVEYRKYTNDEGDIIDVSFVRGKPVNPIPEGYYPVGSKPEEPPEDVTTTENGRDARDRPNPTVVLHRQLSSDKVTRQRNKIIDEISKGILDGDVDPRGEANGMIGYVSNTKIAEDKMLGVMLPDAINLYNGITTDPSFLDKILYKDKTNLEIMVMSTSSTQNARKARGELDPSYISLKEQGSTFMNTNGVKPAGVVISPEEAKKNQEAILGKTPSLKELVVGVVTGAIDLVKSGGIIGAVLDTLSGAADDAEKVVSNILESVSTTGEITPDIEQKIQAIESQAVESQNVIPADRRAVTPPKSPVAGAVPSTSQSPTSYDSAVPSTPAPVNSLTEKERGEMAGTELPAPRLPTTFSSQPDDKERGEMAGTELPDAANPYGLDSHPTYDHLTTPSAYGEYPNITGYGAYGKYPTIKGSTVSAYGPDANITGATLGQTGTTATLGATTSPTPEETDKNNRAKVKKIAIANGFDVDLAIQAYENSGTTGDIEKLFEAEDLISTQDQQDLENELHSNIMRDTWRDQNAVIEAAAAKRKAADALAIRNEQLANQGPAGSGGGDGEGQRQRDREKNAAGGTGGGVRSDSGVSGYQGVSTGEAGRYMGGLITPSNKPKVKKMRKDNTAGLAAKKKSKQKAKAKKGALAAKRT